MMTDEVATTTINTASPNSSAPLFSRPDEQEGEHPSEEESDEVTRITTEDTTTDEEKQERCGLLPVRGGLYRCLHRFGSVRCGGRLATI
jgi:hypothetical protein